MRPLRPTQLVALLIYGGAMVAYIYGFEHRSDADRAREIGPDELLVFSAVAMLHVALGAVVGRWPVLLAPLLSILIAIPAGDYPGRWPETPVAGTLAFQMLLFGMPLVTLGAVVRALLDRRKRTSGRALSA